MKTKELRGKKKDELMKQLTELKTVSIHDRAIDKKKF